MPLVVTRKKKSKETEIINIDSEGEESDSPSRHKNAIGKVDYTFRVDVRGKTLMRNLQKIFKLRYKELVKGKKQPDRYFRHLLDSLNSEYQQHKEDEVFICSLIGVITKIIFRK